MSNRVNNSTAAMVRSTLHLSGRPKCITEIVEANLRGHETGAEKSRLMVLVMKAVDDLLKNREIFAGVDPDGTTVYSKHEITPESFSSTGEEHGPVQPKKEGKGMARQRKLADREGEIGDVVPEEVQEAADEYIKSLRAANKAREKMNTAKESCLNAMGAHNIERVKIDDGGKWLVRKSETKLKTEKIKERKEDSDE